MGIEQSAEVVREFGLVTFVVVVVSALALQAIHLLRLVVQRKLNGHIEPHATVAIAPTCPWSPESSKEWNEVVHDIKTIAKHQDSTALRIAGGEFSCTWKRDEVTGLHGAIDRNTSALVELRMAIDRQRERER